MKLIFTIVICVFGWLSVAQDDHSNFNKVWDFDKFTICGDNNGEPYQVNHEFTSVQKLITLNPGIRDYNFEQPLYNLNKILLSKKGDRNYRTCYYLLDVNTTEISPLVSNRALNERLLKGEERSEWYVGFTWNDSIAVFRQYIEKDSVFCYNLANHSFDVFVFNIPEDQQFVNSNGYVEIDPKKKRSVEKCPWGWEYNFVEFKEGFPPKALNSYGSSYGSVFRRFHSSLTSLNDVDNVIKMDRITKTITKHPIVFEDNERAAWGSQILFTSLSGKHEFAQGDETKNLYQYNSSLRKYVTVQKNIIGVTASGVKENEVVFVDDQNHLKVFDVMTKKVVQDIVLGTEIKPDRLLSKEELEIKKAKDNCVHEVNLLENIPINLKPAKYNNDGLWVLEYADNTTHFDFLNTAYGDVNYDGHEDFIIQTSNPGKIFIVFGNSDNKYKGYMEVVFKDKPRKVRIENQEIIITGDSPHIYDQTKREWRNFELHEYRLNYLRDKNAFEAYEIYYGKPKDGIMECQYVNYGTKIDTLFMPLSINVAEEITYDLDNDGKIDKIEARRTKEGYRDPNSFQLYAEGDEWGLKTELSKSGKSEIFPMKGAHHRHLYGDFNGDGWTDVVVTYRKDYGAFVLLNNQGKSFTKKDIEFNHSTETHFEVFDADQDKKDEFLVIGEGKLKSFGINSSGDLVEESRTSGVINSAYIYYYNPFVDLNYDGVMDYVEVMDRSQHGEGKGILLAPYIGKIDNGKYQVRGFRDIFSDSDLYNQYLDSMRGVWKKQDEEYAQRKAEYQRRLQEYNSGENSSTNESATKVYCDMCNGEGAIYGTYTETCSSCNGGGGESRACSWCQGTGSMVTYFYNDYGKKDSNARPCPKCAGGMAGGGSSCYGCGGKGQVTRTGNHTCPQCAGLRYYYVGANGEVYR